MCKLHDCCFLLKMKRNIVVLDSLLVSFLTLKFSKEFPFSCKFDLHKLEGKGITWVGHPNSGIPDWSPKTTKPGDLGYMYIVLNELRRTFIVR